MINWVFDDPSRLRTMSACPDTVIADDLSFVTGRFPTASLFWYWLSNNQMVRYGIDNRPDRYCYNIGTWVESQYWTGFDGNQWGFKNLFEIIPSVVLEDARNGRALLVIDNINEGFQDDSLYGFWHQSCERYGLPPKCIIYATSNLLEKTTYLNWAKKNGITHTINVIAFAHLEYSQQTCLLKSYRMISWEDHLNRKSKKFMMKDFNCLNRVSRFQREYLTLMMIESGLHRNAFISQNDIKFCTSAVNGISDVLLEKANELLPLIVDDSDFNNNKAMHLNVDIYLNSWVTVITETHADDNPKCCFISEKIWKPIYALHPFMVLGHPGTLSMLREMGYKTFQGLVDERYDNEPFESRVRMIINNLNLLRVIKDKIGWFEQCKEICLHNRDNFIKREFFDTQACKDIVSLYDGLLR